MAQPLSSAVASHFAALKRSAGVVVTYDRDGDAVSLTAIPGRVDYERFGDDIADMGGQAADWLILAADLVLPSGGLTVPARSDTITDANSVVFEVLPRGEGREFEYADQFRNMLRVYCVEIA